MADPATTLLLTPTERERRALLQHPDLSGAAIELCGFGPIVAAARCAALLEQQRPARVILAGIAGAYDAERLPIGSARFFSAVAIDQLGMGEGSGYIPAVDAGFLQWKDSSRSIAQQLPLHTPPGASGGMLLTVQVASASVGDLALKRHRHPLALAEEMEGFGVAAACALADTPLAIVRGVSNQAGDRDKSRWRIDEALAAVAAALAAVNHDDPWELTP